MEGNMRTVQQLLPPSHPYPWLLFFNGEGAQDTQNFCTISDAPKTYTRVIPELVEGELCFVQDGWFLLANYHTENDAKLFLWNPSNLKRINLPLLKHNGIRDGILTISHDQVLSVFLFSTTSAAIFCWYLGDEHWTRVDYREQLKSVLAIEGEEFQKHVEDLISLSNPFYYNGCLYAESDFRSHHLLVEIKNLEPRALKLNSSHILYPKFPAAALGYISKMLESNNELFRIEISHAHDKVIAVVVHKLDFHGKVWHKVESIQDRVFFISDDGSFACQAINPDADGNRVYISLKNHNFVYIYNIEDKTFMISQPFSNLSKKRSHACWFMLDLRMIGSTNGDIGKTLISGKESNDDMDSKKVGDMITNDEFAWKLSSTLSMTDNLSLSPLLVYFEKDNVLSFVHPKDGVKNKYNINVTLDLQPYCEICYSKDGWLLMVVNKHSSFFFNPFAKEQEKPPANVPLTDVLNTRCIAFSHPPASPKCVVVELQRIPYCQTPMIAHVTYPGRKEEWDRLFFEDPNFSLYNISPVFHKGSFYYLNEEGKLGVLKLAGEEDIDFDELEKPSAPCTGYDNSFLAECNGDLLTVFEGCFGEWVRVFRLNEATMTWVQVKSLENHMLFVGNISFSAVANVPGMENKIYFPRFYGQNVVFYSLETNNYHTFESNEVVDFHCMRELVNSSWIEPRWN
ncbi:uncharacterized protein LOC130721913 [Lotus japonicus]|uniref:uncharacterized protein LOC130721913 n=1 Tax=Lotus japonicus TaxID=34305 RepID=UPI002582E22B|nr:uncharacterized protein LOC130721913 [Lotus japonicus]